MLSKAATLTLALSAQLTVAQTTVPYTSPGWQDFGTTNITGLSGNFLPGWTSLTATPDLGDDVFFVPTESLSGVSGDAALWMLNYDPGSIGGVSNESVGLSLNGFTPGETYELNFWATIVTNSFAGWVGNNESLAVDIVGADISTFVSTPLFDPVDADGMNPWTPFTVSFEAVSPTVEFNFGATPIGLDPGGTATRFGIDGLNARLVPTPSSGALLAVSGIFATRRRR